MERWQSPVYCNSLENCRSARAREFESHPFRQNWCVDVMVAYWTVYPVAGVRFPYASPNLCLHDDVSMITALPMASRGMEIPDFSLRCNRQVGKEILTDVTNKKWRLGRVVDCRSLLNSRLAKAGP